MKIFKSLLIVSAIISQNFICSADIAAEFAHLDPSNKVNLKNYFAAQYDFFKLDDEKAALLKKAKASENESDWDAYLALGGAMAGMDRVEKVNELRKTLNKTTREIARKIDLAAIRKSGDSLTLAQAFKSIIDKL